MDEPDWAKVLEVLYNEEDSVYREIEGELSSSHDLVEKSELTVDEVNSALVFLREQGLVEQEGVGQRVTKNEEEQWTHIKYELKEKGFDVAHERELRKKQQNLTEEQKEATDTLADFTVILGVTALVQALAAVVSASRYNVPLAMIYVGLLTILWYKSDDLFHK